MNILIIGQILKIASDSIFDPDIFADPVIGIASDIGKHDSGKHCHLRHQLLFSAAARSENWQLMYPSDTRLESWLEHVRMGELPQRLGQLAQIVGACERTISRIFIRDTGMNYQNWRQQWRLLRAIEMLSEGIQISEVAQQLEFISDSAFIVFFRQHTGTTPVRYLQNIFSESLYK